MSGHSKWSTIKRQKGVKDQKKGLTFTKLANAITIAVKQGGGLGDPDQNFRLRLAVDAARASNMPKENIERAIQRAVDKGGGDLQEAVYEGFAPGGVSVMVEAATDNPARTTAEVKSVFNKNNASFGQPGSVSYQFRQIGRIIVSKDREFDEIFNIALEAGADDIDEEGSEVFIYTKYADLSKVRHELVEKGISIVEADVMREPQAKMEIDDPAMLSKVENFVNLLEGLDDVLKVYTNLA
jgi:YebC/PmpR family DNA-binding regulatory protein